MLLETICILNSEVINIEAHVTRMTSSTKHFGFAAPKLPNLLDLLPKDLRNKKVRCSITYNSTILDIKFFDYTPRIIKSLKLIESDIEYSHKFADRGKLNDLMLQKEDYDEVLIVKDGHITDTTFSNVVFESNEGLFTPNTYLLNGTKRQLLLNKGIIKEAIITPNDLHKYDNVHLINAMLDINLPTAVKCPSGVISL